MSKDEVDEALALLCLWCCSAPETVDGDDMDAEAIDAAPLDVDEDEVDVVALVAAVVVGVACLSSPSSNDRKKRFIESVRTSISRGRGACAAANDDDDGDGADDMQLVLLPTHEALVPRLPNYTH